MFLKKLIINKILPLQKHNENYLSLLIECNDNAKRPRHLWLSFKFDRQVWSLADYFERCRHWSMVSLVSVFFFSCWTGRTTRIISLLLLVMEKDRTNKSIKKPLAGKSTIGTVAVVMSGSFDFVWGPRPYVRDDFHRSFSLYFVLLLRPWDGHRVLHLWDPICHLIYISSFVG